jgi:hypothetical protein
MSMDREAAQVQRQIQTLTQQLAKASDPYLGSPDQAAALKQQISALRFSLDGIDPATGKKVREGLNDRREQARRYLQTYGSRLRGTEIFRQNEGGGLDFQANPDADDGIDPSDPLYRIGMQGAAATPQAGGQPGGVQPGSRGQATPAMIVQLGQQVAAQTGSSLADPAVRQQVRQMLISQGYTIPTIQ